MMQNFRDLCGCGVAVIFLAVDSAPAPTRNRRLSDIPRQSRLNAFCRQTHVCFLCALLAVDGACPRLGTSALASQVECRDVHSRERTETVAFRVCVTPETNCPVMHVNLDRSEEDGKGWRNPGNGSVLDRTLNAYVPVDRQISRTSPSRTYEQTRTESKSERMACAQ